MRTLFHSGTRGVIRSECVKRRRRKGMEEGEEEEERG